MSLCKDCISGVRHEGKPEGTITTIGGVECYIATPTIKYPDDKAILFLPDVFGHKLENAQLLADDFARNGFYTVVPDYLNGDALPADAMSNPKPGFQLMEWVQNHMQPQTRPTLDKVIAGLKEKGVKEFGATGYCFGARYVFDLAFDGVTKVSVVSHPSFLQVPGDFDKYLQCKQPLLINSCEVDQQFPVENAEKVDTMLGGGKFAPGYKREYFPGCSHGFAVRGDLSIPAVKDGKEGAFKAAVEWLIKYM